MGVKGYSTKLEREIEMASDYFYFDKKQRDCLKTRCQEP